MHPYRYGIHDARGVLVDHTMNDAGGRGLNSRKVYQSSIFGTYQVVAAGANGR